MFIEIEEQGIMHTLLTSDTFDFTALYSTWRSRTGERMSFVDWLEFHDHASRVIVEQGYIIP